jgi:alpha-tubulin suppressor-like RCC1 family protein
LLSDGTVRCWGDNTYGQLGSGGSLPASAVPQQIAGLPSAGSVATAISAGEYHTCALQNDGAVLCWGNNGAAQAGDGTMMNPKPIPTPSAGLPEVGTSTAAVASGSAHTCALLSVGSVRCWGDNTFGEVGVSSPQYVTEPRRVLDW